MRGSWRHLPSFHVAGVAPGDIYRRFARQAWHLATLTLLVLRGRHSTWRHPPWFRVAGLALVGTRNFVTNTRTSLSHTTLSHTSLPHTIFHTHTHNSVTHHLSHTTFTFTHISLSHTIFHTHKLVTYNFNTHTHNFVTHNFITYNFVKWHAWQLATSAFVSRGRRGTWRHLPSFCAAGVALIGLGLALVARLGAVTPRHFCVAGAALGDICLRFTWQAWHLATSIFVSRGRRGTYGLGLALVAHLGAVMLRHFCVAGVAVGDICLRFTWQARHLATSTVVLRGRRGTYGTRLALVARFRAVTPRHFCVACVAVGDICLRFTWQAWHLATSTVVSRGRCGTWRH